MIAAPSTILKVAAIFQRIASDCTTVTLVDTKSFKTGIVVLHYQPDRDSQDK